MKEDFQKIVAQMRQYVHTDDTGHECRVNSHTITVWANAIEQLAKKIRDHWKLHNQLYDLTTKEHEEQQYRGADQ